MTGETAGIAATIVPSFGEVEATVRKAARGAGMSWGMADEAAAAVRQLEVWGEPALEPLAFHLKALDVDLAALQPRGPITPTGPAERRLCPIAVGVQLADGAFRPEDHGGALPPILYPILMLPFVCAASPTGTAIEFTVPDAVFICARYGFMQRARRGTIARWTLQTTQGAVPKRQAADPRAVPIGVWDELLAFAARTYVPASEGSRLAGAGSGTGLTDND